MFVCLFVIIVSFTLMNLFVAKKDLYTVFVFSIDNGKWKTVNFQMCMMIMMTMTAMVMVPMSIEVQI